MKIYTKAGDFGKTTLISTKKISKNNKIIEALGQLDEFNSVLGIIKSEIKNIKLIKKIERIQNDLFIIGSELAVYDNSKQNYKKIKKKQIAILEEEIDEWEVLLKPTSSFIIPGKTKISSFVFWGRSICRRFERSLVSLNKYKINPLILKYTNRLSDWLFILSRLESEKVGKNEININYL